MRLDFRIGRLIALFCLRSRSKVFDVRWSFAYGVVAYTISSPSRVKGALIEVRSREYDGHFVSLSVTCGACDGSLSTSCFFFFNSAMCGMLLLESLGLGEGSTQSRGSTFWFQVPLWTHEARYAVGVTDAGTSGQCFVFSSSRTSCGWMRRHASCATVHRIKCVTRTRSCATGRTRVQGRLLLQSLSIWQTLEQSPRVTTDHQLMKELHVGLWMVRHVRYS